MNEIEKQVIKEGLVMLDSVITHFDSVQANPAADVILKIIHAAILAGEQFLNN